MAVSMRPGLDYRAYLITHVESSTRTSRVGYPGRVTERLHNMRGDAKRMAIECAAGLLSWQHEPIAWTCGTIEVEHPHGDVFRFHVEPKLVHTPAETFEGECGEETIPPVWAVEWTAKHLESVLVDRRPELTDGWVVLSAMESEGRLVDVVAAKSYDGFGVVAHWEIDHDGAWMLSGSGCHDDHGSAENENDDPLPCAPPLVSP